MSVTERLPYFSLRTLAANDSHSRPFWVFTCINSFELFARRVRHDSILLCCAHLGICPATACRMLQDIFYRGNLTLRHCEFSVFFCIVRTLHYMPVNAISYITFAWFCLAKYRLYWTKGLSEWHHELGAKISEKAGNSAQFVCVLLLQSNTFVFLDWKFMVR